MTANDVYNIAKALPNEELERLCDMLSINKARKVKYKRKPMMEPDFTVEDCMRLLMATHFSKVRKP